VDDIAAQKRADAAAANKKAAPVGKSSVILDVKPWGLETSMEEMEKCVRDITIPGLRWAGSQLEKVAYGVMMLRINAVISDDVSVDEIQEQIEANEELVQSTDIYAFNKL